MIISSLQGISIQHLTPMEVLMALQNAESRGENFSKEDFLEGRVGARMIPEDFNFEENVSFSFFSSLSTNPSL